RKQAEIKLKQEALARSQTNQDNSLEQTANREAPADVFTEFEKKAGFKIKDELLPALGNEIAVGGSFKSLQMLGVGVPTPPTPKPSPETEEEKQGQKGKENPEIPVLMIAVKDRETVRRLMPRVLNGLGIGEANLIAQVEKREDTEMVNYAG